MPATDAIVLSNWFPTVEKVTIREGYSSFCTGIGTGDVETLFEHHAGSNRQLLAIGSDGVLYQIDSGSAVSKKTGLANGRAETAEFNNLTRIRFILEKYSQYINFPIFISDNTNDKTRHSTSLLK